MCVCGTNGNCEDNVCKCSVGFRGERCEYRDNEVESASKSITEYLKNLNNLVTTNIKQSADAVVEIFQQLRQFIKVEAISPIIEIIGEIFNHPNQINSDTNTKLIRICSQLLYMINNLEQQENFEESPDILKNLLKTIKNKIVPKVTSSKSFQLSTEQFKVYVGELNLFSDLQISLDNQLNIDLDSRGQPNQVSQPAKISIIAFKNNPYASITPDTLQQLSKIIEVNVFKNDELVKFNGSLKIERMTNRTLSNPPLCLFMNTESLKWESTGCGLDSYNSEKVSCVCNHTTSFGSFLNTGYSVLKDSNYNMFGELMSMNFDDIVSNIGFYFSLIFFSLYAIIGISCNHFDKRKIRDNFQNLVVKEFSAKESKIDKIEVVVSKSVNTQNDKFKVNNFVENIESTIQTKIIGNQSTRSLHQYHSNQGKIKKNKISPFLQIDFSHSTQVKPAQISQRNATSSFRQSSLSLFQKKLHPIKIKTGSDVQSIQTTSNEQSLKKINQTQAPKSSFQGIMNKLKRKKNQSCCRFFLKTTAAQVSQNNLIVNTISKTSVKSSRCLRDTFFFMAIILQFSLCALFFDLSPPSQQENESFLDKMIENFWVGLYSAIFAMIPMICLGCCLTFPKKYTKALNSVDDRKNLVSKFTKLNKKYRVLIVFGYFLFWIVSLFLSVYLICFVHLANQKLSSQWLRSSCMGAIIDIIAFEVLAAVAVSMLALIASCCKFCRWVVYLAILIELYRQYRNLTS